MDVPFPDLFFHIPEDHGFEQTLFIPDNTGGVLVLGAGRSRSQTLVDFCGINAAPWPIPSQQQFNY